jgi:hypothetical protein
MTSALAVALALALTGAAGAETLAVRLPRSLSLRAEVRLSLAAPALPDGGYYYAVVVLRPYRHHTRSSPPSCATSSDMQRTDYGVPTAAGRVSLALAPSRSRSGRWCPRGSYEGAVYAVPHPPPCEGRYPCRSEPYEPSPCWPAGGHVVCGVVALPAVWHYPDPLPRPLASGTAIVARFSLRFPSR